MAALIVGENITRSFGRGDESRNILDKVSVHIGRGEFVAVMGPSGSGKSTLLFALSGMDKMDGGRVMFDGVDLSTLTEKKLADLRRTQMGFVFQQPTLLRNLNILDNVMLPSMRDRRKHGAKLLDRARELLTQMGLAGLEHRDITQASGGQLQRVGLCRALMGEPKIIFGDEPTGALNSASAIDILKMLAEIHRNGTTILLVTHDVKVAARTERVLLLIDGQIVGEYRLGRCEEDRCDLRTREESLTAWLTEMNV